MKNNLFVLALLVLCFFRVLAQHEKHDYRWFSGDAYCSPTIYYHGTTDLSFLQGDTLNMARTCRPVGYSVNGTFSCDAQGLLQVYTNGCRIFDRFDNILLNGDSINYSDGAIWDAYSNIGYPVPRGCIFLPYPGTSYKYVLFHQSVRVVPFGVGFRDLSDEFFYSTVDMEANGGTGAVVEREVLLTNDSMASSSLSACRHANGRDWWVLLPESGSNCYDLWLLGPAGVTYRGRQCLGQAFSWVDWTGQAGFSPDGEWYARTTAIDDLHLYRFDRCTGLLSEHRPLPFMGYPQHLGNSDHPSWQGAGFSSNSRFLYATTGTKVFQYDTWAPDIQASRILVDTFVYMPNPILALPSGFGGQWLAPDGQLYIFDGTGNIYAHLIRHPDSLGTECGFEQDALLSLTIFSAAPNFPHFRSGPLEGSTCDTLGLNSLSPSTDWLDFGSVPPGGDSLRGFWARSHVGYPATVRQLDLPAGSAFAAGPLAPLYAIPKYDSVWVPVRFAPVQTGTFDDTLFLRTNYGHLAVRLTGTSDTITSALPAAPQYSALRLWPNPTAGNVQLSFSASHAGETLLTVHDALGRTVLALPVQVVAGSNRFALPLEGLPGGVYSVILRGVGSGRVVKH